eukprot:3513380-Pleurochrysis_carterae.AAC.1
MQAHASKVYSRFWGGASCLKRPGTTDLMIAMKLMNQIMMADVARVAAQELSIAMVCSCACSYLLRPPRASSCEIWISKRRCCTVLVRPAAYTKFGAQLVGLSVS